MELWQALCLALIVSFATRGCATSTTVALFLNWCINTGIAVHTGSQFHWMAMAAVDWVTALIILALCPNRWTALIVGLYAIELVAHVAYGLSSRGPWPQYRYWHVLYYAAWAQAAITLIWSGLDGGRVVRDRLDPDGRLVAAASLRHRLGLLRSKEDR